MAADQVHKTKSSKSENEMASEKRPLEEEDEVRPGSGLPVFNLQRFCYRHNPDIQSSKANTACYKQDVKRFKSVNDKISQLPTNEREEVHHIVSTFSKSNDKLRKLILEGLLTACCFPQLSYVASQVQNMIKIDFIGILPQEISLKILCYLDCQSLCSAAKVCRKWKIMADDDRVWHRMCEQHIDRKCPNCGWGLPRLHMKRARSPPKSSRCRELITGAPIPCTVKGGAPQTRRGTTPWKVIYRDRFKVESNWRKGQCLIQEFKGHMDGVLTLQFSPRLLFTGSYDSTVAIWDLCSGRLIRRLSGHSDGVKALYFDEQKVITGSLDKAIRVWNYITGECVSTYRGHTDSVLSVDSYKKIIVSGSADKTVKVWHIESRTCYSLRGHTEWVNCVKLHPSSFLCFSCSDDTTIRMWDIRTNACLRVFRGHVGQVQKVIPLTIIDIANLVVDDKQAAEPPEPDISPVILNEDLPYPTHLLSCSLDNTIKLWDVRTGKCVRTQFGHVEGVWDIAADNFRIVSGSHDGKVKLWDLQSGRCLHTFQGKSLQEPHRRTNDDTPHKVSPIACVGIGDSEFFTGDEMGFVKRYRFDTT